MGVLLLRKAFVPAAAQTRPTLQTVKLQQQVMRLTVELAEARQSLQQVDQARRQMLSRVEQTREEERLHIARELHDELGGALTCLKMDAYRLMKQDSMADDVRQGLLTLTEDIDLAIELMRNVATELRPTVLEQIGLGAALQSQFEAFLDRTGLDGEFLRAQEDVPLAGEPAIACYRVFQEALTNIARHAQATWIGARLEAAEDEVILYVTDNGRGFSAETDPQHGGLGLAGMQERASLLGADLQIKSVPGQGTTVRLAIPRAIPIDLVSAPGLRVSVPATVCEPT